MGIRRSIETDVTEPATTAGDEFSSVMRPWRSHNRLAVLRLRTDVTGASRVPVKRAGDLVLACWHEGKPFATGWMLHHIGFACVLNEPDVEVIERSVDRITADRRLDREDFDIQIEEVRRSVRLGYYAVARAELRGAMMILDTMEKRDGR